MIKMIEVKNAKGYLRVSGHANDVAHPRCEDSIRACEAITALSHTLVASIQSIGGDKPYYNLKKGNLYITTADLSVISRALIDAFMVGAEMLATAYKDYIEIVRE